jgi:hypothetical protein
MQPTAASWRAGFRAVAVILGLGLALGGAARARAGDTLDRAEQLYQTDQLQKAEQLFRTLLPRESAEGKERCYERLLAVYVRLGRLDQAIQWGQRYRDWLRENRRPERAREVTAELGGWYLALGHLRPAEGLLEEALAPAKGEPPLSAARRLEALTRLAQCAEQRGDRERAGQRWVEAEELALARLADARQPLAFRERVRVTWGLSDGYRFLKQPTKAIAHLTPLLRLHDEAEDLLGKRDTLRRLAEHQAAAGDAGAAEAALLEALALHEKHTPKDALTRGYLTHDLTDLLQALPERGADAERWRGRAVEAYGAVLRDPGAGQPGVAGAVSAFWKLQAIHQRAGQHDRALRLALSQAEQWGDGLLLPRLRTEQGSLEFLLGQAVRARDSLRSAVADLEGQSPPNLIELPRALNNLAHAELTTDEVGRAEAAARKCLDLYSRFKRPDDVVLVEAYDVLGSCAALGGDYALAIERYRVGVGLCRKLGAVADPQHSNLLLNVALLFKAQGDPEEAHAALKEARQVYGRFTAEDALGFAAFDAAEANLLLTQGRLAETLPLSRRILAQCEKHSVTRGPLPVTARHCEALLHLERRELDAAEEALRAVLAWQKEDRSPQQPRTLNALGLAAELRRLPEEAERSYREALALQKNNPRAFPVTHFVTLWRLATVLDGRGAREEARGCWTTPCPWSRRPACRPTAAPSSAPASSPSSSRPTRNGSNGRCARATSTPPSSPRRAAAAARCWTSCRRRTPIRAWGCRGRRRRNCWPGKPRTAGAWPASAPAPCCCPRPTTTPTRPAGSSRTSTRRGDATPRRGGRSSTPARRTAPSRPMTARARRWRHCGRDSWGRTRSCWFTHSAATAAGCCCWATAPSPRRRSP